MSTEQDKDIFSIKRHRGGDGGLEGLGGPSVLLGSPDKKKCKSQQTPSFSTLTEYAPPPNPSTDHLVAANPFDDSYSPSFKPLSVGNQYFSPSQYPGLGSYGPPRTAPVMSGRMVSHYNGPYPVRSQLHPFLQNQAGFNRPPGFTYGHQENPTFRNQSLFSIKYNNMSLPPNQLARPGLGDTINQVPLHYVVHAPPPEHTGPSSGPETHPSRNLPPRTNADFCQGLTHQENSFSLSNTTTPKSEVGDASSRKTSQNTSPRKPSQVSEEVSCRDSDLRSRNRGSSASQEVKGQKLNGIAQAGNPGNPSDLGNDAPKMSPQTGRTMEQAPPEKNIAGCGGGRGMRGDGGEGAGNGNGSGGRAKHKTGMHPNRSSLSLAEPVYPCGICLNEVNDDQEAIMCEALCQKWFHRVCTGMTETAYNLLTAEAWAVWGCDSCMKDKGALLLRTKEHTVPVSTEG
ncbi:pygopus homolog 1 isoform X1 [Hypomesus transpacificus]|uniref:pygopus homolog 1 isoform X1 n=1 Tax=Hypomesus transpacificus TaxID=137520 RepID=UPI001F08396B|nr:pygopus homolog 1 isoform X1 [Hypomesus transpacificus]